MIDPNIKINKFLEAMEADSVSKEDFIDFAKVIIQALKDMKSTLSDDIREFKRNIQSDVGQQNYSINSVKKSVDNLWSTLEGKNRELISEISSQLESKIDKISTTIPPRVDLKSLETRLASQFEQKLNSTQIAIKGLIPRQLTAEAIRDNLELLKGDDRLDKSAIKGLEEEFERIRKSHSNVIIGGSGGKGKIKPYDLSSQLDGVTKTFNIPASWTVISVASTSNPAAFRPIIDYTFTPTTITFTSEINAATTLSAGQSLIVVLEES